MKKIISFITTAALTAAMLAVFTAFASAEPVTVLFRNSIVSDLTNQIDIRYQITANENIDLSKLIIRYYYTNSDGKSQNYYVDYSDIDSSYVTGTFSTIDPAADKADSCFDVGFTGGTMSADDAAVMCIRVTKTDWSNYDQTENYSYNSTDTGEYIQWDKINVYYDGNLIQGIEPSDAGEVITPVPTETPDTTPTPEPTEVPDPTEEPEATPTPAPQSTPAVDSAIWVQTLGDHENTPNTMYVWYKIISRTNEDIDLSRITIKYYYTNDNNQEQIMECDNFQDETVTNRDLDAVTSSFYALSETADNMNYCYELSFTEDAGTLNSYGFIRVDTRIHNADWSNYNFSNDYSYNSSDEFIYWDKVEVYIDGELAWGENLEASVSDDEKYIPVRTMGFEYEQTYNIDSNVVKPEITGANVEILDAEAGLYRITITDDQYVCDDNAAPFFFWSAREGVFSEPSDNYNSVIFQADEGTGHRQVKVIVGIGDGLGYVDKKAILLDGNKTGGDNE